MVQQVISLSLLLSLSCHLVQDAVSIALTSLFAPILLEGGAGRKVQWVSSPERTRSHGKPRDPDAQLPSHKHTYRTTGLYCLHMRC